MKECCKEQSNLQTSQDGDREVAVCRVCGCRHIRVRVDPGRLGMRGGLMGRRV